MRKPVFLDDISHLGEYFWIEVDGYDTMLRRQAGHFGGVQRDILGWDCTTLREIFQKEKEVNFAPRVRYWEGEEPPSPEERESGSWANESRLWMPDEYHLSGEDAAKKWEEFLQTGRTQWPVPPDPEDPVALNAELYAKGEEPLAPMCAGCHWGKWKKGTDRRWVTKKDGSKIFLPCTNIGCGGWNHWAKRKRPPQRCSGFCKIGEHRPSGFWNDIKNILEAFEEKKVGEYEQDDQEGNGRISDKERLSGSQ